MGLISPNMPAVRKADKDSRKLFDQALADFGLVETEDADGVRRMNVQRLAMSLWNDALYAESPKDRQGAAKLIYERVRGKPKVIEDEEQEEMPEIVLRVNPKTSEQLKQLAERDDVEPQEEQEGKVIVKMDGEPDMEF